MKIFIFAVLLVCSAFPHSLWAFNVDRPHYRVFTCSIKITSPVAETTVTMPLAFYDDFQFEFPEFDLFLSTKAGRRGAELSVWGEELTFLKSSVAIKDNKIADLHITTFKGGTEEGRIEISMSCRLWGKIGGSLGHKMDYISALNGKVFETPEFAALFSPNIIPELWGLDYWNPEESERRSIAIDAFIKELLDE